MFISSTPQTSNVVLTSADVRWSASQSARQTNARVLSIYRTIFITPPKVLMHLDIV